ncbi:hypothetical protein HK096_005169, partial [Nowakowskiella sp. JEL0078]
MDEEWVKIWSGNFIPASLTGDYFGDICMKLRGVRYKLPPLLLQMDSVMLCYELIKYPSLLIESLFCSEGSIFPIRYSSDMFELLISVVEDDLLENNLAFFVEYPNSRYPKQALDAKGLNFSLFVFPSKFIEGLEKKILDADHPKNTLFGLLVVKDIQNMPSISVELADLSHLPRYSIFFQESKAVKIDENNKANREMTEIYVESEVNSEIRKLDRQIPTSQININLNSSGYTSEIKIPESIKSTNSNIYLISNDNLLPSFLTRESLLSSNSVSSEYNIKTPPSVSTSIKSSPSLSLYEKYKSNTQSSVRTLQESDTASRFARKRRKLLRNGSMPCSDDPGYQKVSENL